MEHEQLLRLSSIKTNVVDRHLEDTEMAPCALARHPLLPDVFDDAEARTAVPAQWDLIRDVFPERSWVYFGTPDNKILVRPTWEPPEGYDCRIRPWYRQARFADDVLWVEPYDKYITSEMMMAAAVPIHDATGSFGEYSGSIRT